MNPEQQTPVNSDPDALLYTAEQVANHPLVKGSRKKGSVALVYAVKKAAKGQADNPFSGRVTTARKFSEWLLNHREFVATHWLRKKKAPAGSTSLAQQPAAA